MSDTEKQYAITVTAAELDNLRATLSLAVDRSVRDRVYREIDRSTLAALDAAKPVKRRARKTPEPEPEPFIPDTGDEKLDAWLIAHHRPDWKTHLATALKPRRHGMMPMPAPASRRARKPMTQQERADLYRVHVIRSVGV